jgi:hypothetical protein
MPRSARRRTRRVRHHRAGSGIACAGGGASESDDPLDASDALPPSADAGAGAAARTSSGAICESSDGPPADGRRACGRGRVSRAEAALREAGHDRVEAAADGG